MGNFESNPQAVALLFLALLSFALVCHLIWITLSTSIEVIFGALGNAWREFVEQIKGSISR